MSFALHLLIGFGFCLLIEGALYALFPRQTQAMMETVLRQQPDRLRLIGLGLFVAGFLTIWMMIG